MDHINTICILAARDEEAFAARFIFEEEGKVKFEHPTIDGDFSYQRGTFKQETQDVNIIISFARDQGENFTLDLAKDFINKFQPILAIMTGVCAGKRGKTKLGDLVVAEKAFFYKSGKDTNDGFKPAPTFFGPQDQFLGFVKMTMSKNKQWKKYPKIESQISKRFKKQWLLRAFYEYGQNDQKSAWCEKNKFDMSTAIPLNQCVQEFLGGEYRDLVEEMKREKEISIESGKIKIADKIKEEIESCVLLYGDFPLPDRQASDPQVYFGVYGSGPSVRSDDKEDKRGIRRSKVFEECEVVHRDTIAVDMEAAAFYQSAEKKRDTNVLVVKGVSDHGDSEKDDSFHEYGKQLAASFALEVIREYLKQYKITQSHQQTSKSEHSNPKDKPYARNVTYGSKSVAENHGNLTIN